MLYWALVFLLVAIVAAFFGFSGITAVALGISRILFFIFLVLFILSLIFGLRARRPVVKTRIPRSLHNRDRYITTRVP